MHIGIDATSWSNERGFGRFTRGLLRALAARDTGFRYTLLFDQPPDILTPDGMKVVVAGSSEALTDASKGASRRSGGYLFRLSAAARRLEADVFFYPAIYSWFPVLSRTPSIICYHDTIPERFPNLIFPTKKNEILWRLKTKAARILATRTMTVSQASADDLSDILNIPRTRIDVVTEGADDIFQPLPDQVARDAARARFDLPADAPLLLYVGGFNRHKNVIRLIQAMSTILETRPNAYLAIVGRITGDRFWDNIDELQAGVSADARKAAQITFTGEIDDADLAALTGAADALIFPSLYEGFGLPALEAMSCGTPVLASDAGSLPEILGGAGLLFDPTSAPEIADTVLRFLDDPALQADLRARALARAGDFSWDTAAALAEEAFRRTAAR